jgi:TDG/mug DNA glycosylase family protein
MPVPMTHGGLPDVLRPGLNAVLVGINAGLRSAQLGHHFAGRGNRFWTLLYASKLTPKLLTYQEDSTLTEYGLGLTNIAGRATRSSSDLRREDFTIGRMALEEKIKRFEPKWVAFVGVTVYREYLRGRRGSARKIKCGIQKEPIGSSRVFVLPNPSGRNAHFSYDEMLRLWKRLARQLKAKSSTQKKPIKEKKNA